MTLLKNTIFITLLLLFSLKLSRCQEATWTWEGTVTETVVNCEETTTTIEETTITETVPVGWSEETTTTRVEEFPITEVSPIEEVIVVEEPFGETATTTTEETVTTENTYGWSEETATTIEETVTTEETVVTEETVTTEETVVSEESLEEGSEGEEEGPEGEEEGSVACPQYIEETEVDGYFMTFHPCCVSSNAECGNNYEPVCIERVRCEDEHCRWHYETVENVCQACKGHGNWQYSKGKCPWEGGDNRLRYRHRKHHN